MQAFVVANIAFPSILRALGYLSGQVTPAFALMSSDYYIAFSKTNSPATVQQWQQVLDAARLDGTYNAIYLKWFN